ncbi:DUF4349 domain-containing protein [Microbacterium sp. bgisy203]|uniref:DUF4349 domain-containing protein n=1 Tax=Microbacterium sp. bgisy203 TaxID=3413799 RepID=UPI003D764E0A
MTGGDMNIDDITLPELTDLRLDEIETELFARIADERRDARAEQEAARRVADAERARARAARRGRIWMGAAAAAAVVAVAAIIAPQLGGGSVVGTASEPLVLNGARGDAYSVPEVGSEDAPLVATGAAATAAGAKREIVATASASLTVDDTKDAADAITDEATTAGGYVEALSLGGGQAVTPEGALVDTSSYPAPTGAWISVRIPADRLTDVLSGLSKLGEVTASQVDRRDVTTEAVDLRARVDALQASVTRLTELVAQASSTSDVIAAESALSERQAELDSLRQQLTLLDDQVAMSTLTVSLTEPQPAATADPAGFGDGVAAGWHGLVATLNGLVIALGFLLPWLAVIAVLGAVVWGIRRALRRRRARSVEVSEEA